MEFLIKFLLVLSCCFGGTYSLDLSGCGDTKQCIMNPPSCSESDPTCLIFTYQWNSEASTFTMEIRGGAGGGSTYSAVAFSSNAQMDDADLYYCTGSELKSGAIEVRFARPSTDDSLPENVVELVAQTDNGVAECRFVRPASVTKTIQSSPITFDLSTTEYHLLQAHGSLSGDTPPQLTQHGGAPARAASTDPIDFTSTTASRISTAPATTTAPVDDGIGCGVTVGCFRDPVNCLPADANCKFVSWVYDESSDTFNFDMSGAQDRYVAIAFGTEAAMANADLYYCSGTEFVSGAIRTTNQPPGVDDSLPAEITDMNIETTNGVLRCTFTRAASVTKSILSGPTDFDLASAQYYLLYANGPLAGGALSYHQSDRMRTPSQVDFRAISTLGGGVDTMSLVKAHAALMIIAWLTCASIGVIIARHFKPMWHNETLFGTKVWFQLHRGLMITALLCTLIAFILIFVAVGGYSTEIAHPIIGLIVTALVVINPCMALFRPHPNTPRRPIFNWAHWFVGTSARILAIVAIFLGVDLPRLNLPDWDTWLLVGFVVFHIVVEISLEIVSAVYGHIDVYKKPVQSDKFDMGGDAEPPSEPRPKGTSIKYAILFIYAVVNLSVLVTFIIFIARQ